MHVTGDLAFCAGRRMTKGQRADRQRSAEAAADTVGRIGIVVAGDPDPITPALEGGERRAIARRDPVRAIAVVEAVAQRDHHAWRVAGDEEREPCQGRRGIIGREQHAARGEARALLQMQVRDRQDALFVPVERTLAIGGDHDPRDGDLRRRSLPRVRSSPPCDRLSTRHRIASFTSSASACASSSSDASPETSSRPISSITGTASGET